MQLFLTSSAVQVMDRLVPLLPFEPSGSTAGFVTTATNVDEDKSWMEAEIAAIARTGMAVRRIDLAELSNGDVNDAFDGADVIWVGGGNTYYLLQEVRRTGFDAFVTDKLAEGVPYVGTSAGSILLAPDVECIRPAEEHPDVSLDSFEGLGLFPLVTLAHINDPWFKDVYREILMLALEQDAPFITLRDNEFIHVEGDHWRLIST